MKAVVFSRPETIEIATAPDPICGPDEVIVRVARSGICGTDIHIYHNEYMSRFPLIPGHEFSGTVVEAGRNVRHLAVGARVAVDPNLHCGYCDACQRMQFNHCRNFQAIGVTRDGGFAEYVHVPVQAVYPLPEGMTFSQAAFVEPLACAVWALQRMHVQPADSILIMGAGPMGLLLLQALRHGNGSRIVLVDKQPGRLQLAAQLGATQVVQADAVEALAEHPFEVVIDATGVPAVIEQSFRFLKPRGQFLQFGVTARTAQVRISPYDIFHNDWTIIGSFALCQTFPPAIAWLEHGVIDVAPLISHELPLADFAEGFAKFHAGETLKVHLRVSD